MRARSPARPRPSADALVPREPCQHHRRQGLSRSAALARMEWMAATATVRASRAGVSAAIAICSSVGAAPYAALLPWRGFRHAIGTVRRSPIEPCVTATDEKTAPQRHAPRWRTVSRAEEATAHWGSERSPWVQAHCTAGPVGLASDGKAGALADGRAELPQGGTSSSE